MKLDLSTVGISCVACGTRTTLEKAIYEGWQQCLRCHFFIDPSCLQIVHNTMNGACPSFSHGVNQHTLEAADISSEKILIFVKDQYQQGRHGGLIDGLFYSKSPPLPQSPTPHPFNTEEDSLTREEVWGRYGLVLVCRTHGKWVTWEKICPWG